MERLQNTQFTFTNKENAHIPQKAPPKTPRQSKSLIFKSTNVPHNNNTSRRVSVHNDVLTTPNKKLESKPLKRVPLGGKDKNAGVGFGGVSQKPSTALMELHVSASAKKRARRLRTPLGASKGVNRKLDILRDSEFEVVKKTDVVPSMMTPVTRRVAVDDDDEVEHVSVKQPELPYTPFNYEPFTEEDLEVLRKSPSARLEDKRDELSDVGSSDVELPVNLNFDDYDDGDDDDDELNRSSHSLPHFMEPTFVSNAKKVKKTDPYTEGLSIAELQSFIDEE